MRQSPAEALTRFIQLYQPKGPLPILWVGAGVSAAAGLPTLAMLEERLRQALFNCTATGFELIDAFVKEYGEASMANQLQTLLGGSFRPVGLHESMARMAGRGLFAAIFTTNYDELIEDALKGGSIHYVPQVLQQNFTLQARTELQVLKLHGSRTDWKSVILSGESYRRFEKTYPLLHDQLSLNLLTHPLLFVGCSMKDPRVLGWLRGRTEEDRRGLYGGRVLITSADWAKLTEEEVGLLASANIKPIEVESYPAIAEVLAQVARELVPLEPVELVFEITPGDKTWTVVGPTRESPSRQVPNPLADTELVSRLNLLRETSSQPVVEGAPDSREREALMRSLSRAMGGRLTELLLSAEARAQVVRGIHQAAVRGRARLTLRVREGAWADQALALPWELLMPEEGRFAVEDMVLDLVREAVVEGAPTLEEPTGPLSLAVTVSAPEDQTALRYEDEAFRLHQSLVPSGHRVVFSELGNVEDLVRTAAAADATAIHFSGHGLPGGLVFEDEVGTSKVIGVDELVRGLHEHLTPSGGARKLPKLFFLASCHGASGSSEVTGEGGEELKGEPGARELRAALGRGPSTAAALHRGGFVQVVGYFGPISDPLCTRAEERFYEELAGGGTTLQAVARARASLREPVELKGVRVRHPLAWMQLALYHRGPDRLLARPGRETPGERARRFIRKEKVEVNRLPVLELGFIGRRSLQHLVRRKVRDGQRLLALQGLGGLGKTALASHLVRDVFAPDPSDALILTCQGLGVDDGDPIEALWAQVEEHGRLARVEGWEVQVRKLREEGLESASGFERAVSLLRRARPKLVLYADNTETLQVGPGGAETQALGAWHPKARAWWEAMERLAREGLLVMASTRYRWTGMDPKAWLPIEPMRGVDSLRMIESFEGLGRLPHALQTRLAEMVDGHPRTVEYLDRLVDERMKELEKSLEEVGDVWVELIEPVLPKKEEKLTADLLLDKLWERLSEGAREHARTLSVLRVPAPRSIIEKLGGGTAELIRAGVLTRVRELVKSREEAQWAERWGMHSLVAGFVRVGVEEGVRRVAHLDVGRAYADWVGEPGALWSEQEEGIFHLHEVGEGDRAWSMVQKYVLWLRDAGRYKEALSLLERCESVGTSGDRLAMVLALLGQMRRILGEISESIWADLVRALGFAESEETRAVLLSEQGGLRRAQGKYGEAEGLLRQSLAIKEKALGVEHPSLCPSLVNLGAIIAKQGRPSEGEQYVGRALRIAQAVHGAHHPVTAQILSMLAQLQAGSGNSEAPETARMALEALEHSLGLEHPFVRKVAPVLNAIQGKGGLLQPTSPRLDMEAVARLEQGKDALDAGDFQRAITVLTSLVDPKTDEGIPFLNVNACFFLALALFRANRGGEALARANQGLRLAEHVGEQEVVASFQNLVRMIEAGGER